MDKKLRATVSVAEWSKAPIYDAAALEWRWWFELLVKHGYHLRDFIDQNRNATPQINHEAVTIRGDLEDQERTLPEELRKELLD